VRWTGRVPLALTEIDSSSKYELEGEFSIESTLSLYNSSSPTPPPLSSSPTPINLPPAYNNMSQHDLYTIIRQQHEQLVVMQDQLQAIQAGAAARIPRLNIGFNTEVAKPQVFDRSSEKVLGSIMACRLYIRMKMREKMIEE